MDGNQMKKTILVGCDRTDKSIPALAWAALLVPVHPGSRVHLIHVLPPAPQTNVAVDGPREWRARDRASVVYGELKQVEGAMLAGIKYSLEICYGNPPDAILAAAAHVGAHLLVLGSTPRTPARPSPLPLGVVTREILHRAQSPVLLARGRVPLALPGRLLVAVDGSVTSASALWTARHWFPQAHVTVLYVAGPAEPEADGLNVLRQMVNAAGLGADAAVDTQVRVGQPGPEISRTADALGGIPIVMGSRGLSRTEELRLGSVTRAVLVRSRQPLLIVR